MILCNNLSLFLMLRNTKLRDVSFIVYIPWNRPFFKCDRDRQRYTTDIQKIFVILLLARINIPVPGRAEMNSCFLSLSHTLSSANSFYNDDRVRLKQAAGEGKLHHTQFKNNFVRSYDRICTAFHRSLLR